MVDNNIYACCHDQLNAPESLNLTSEGMMKEGIIYFLMVLLKSSKPLG